ncbi:MAG: hypothetical protein HC848_09125 [Limnobacter sp.]|nr:hypothetical protein [Limnobacter sp.]
MSAEHGVGQLKAEFVKSTASPQNYGMLLAIKAAMDPENILNPGKCVLP